MRQLMRPVFLVVLMMAVATTSAARAQSVQKQANATITGRVMLGSEGLPNVSVILLAYDPAKRRLGAIAKVVTDHEGRYRLMNVAAGSYTVMPSAAAFVMPGEGMYGEMGRNINLAEGETVENVDISLKRGGVITGRVTDADGAPAVGERVRLEFANKNERRRSFSIFTNPFMYETDDRGVYRLFGLPAGRYLVSVGDSAQDGYFSSSGKGVYYTRTFHPAATEESKATAVEVTEGGEVTNVDISLGRPGQTYSASGRVVDENGKPAANVRIGNAAMLKSHNVLSSFGYGTVADAEGRFRLDNLAPGLYAVFVWNEGVTEGYTEPLRFEITEADVSGLELKLRRGASISGVVVIEGTTDKTVLSKLSQLSLVTTRVSEDRLLAPTFAPAKVLPDGTFRFIGLQPGKVRIHLGNPPMKEFSLPRIERDGVAVEEIEVTPGAEITNLRAVISYGTGRVRGIVKVENGTLPQGTRMVVAARRLDDTASGLPKASPTDSRGSFLLEGLPTGEYELNLHVTIMEGMPRRLAPIKQKVSVNNGAEAVVTLTLDLGAKPAEGGNNE